MYQKLNLHCTFLYSVCISQYPNRSLRYPCMYIDYDWGLSHSFESAIQFSQKKVREHLIFFSVLWDASMKRTYFLRWENDIILRLHHYCHCEVSNHGAIQFVSQYQNCLYIDEVHVLPKCTTHVQPEPICIIYIFIRCSMYPTKSIQCLAVEMACSTWSVLCMRSQSF